MQSISEQFSIITGGSLDKSVAPCAAAVGTLSVGLESHNCQGRAGHSRHFETVAKGDSVNTLPQVNAYSTTMARLVRLLRTVTDHHSSGRQV